MQDLALLIREIEAVSNSEEARELKVKYKGNKDILKYIVSLMANVLMYRYLAKENEYPQHSVAVATVDLQNLNAFITALKATLPNFILDVNDLAQAYDHVSERISANGKERWAIVR